MQANSAEHQSLESSSSILGIASGLVDGSDLMMDDSVRHTSEPTYFHGYYTSCMEMYADVKTVASYLDAHREWFRRCAHPMKTEPLGENGYALTVGRFGSFGYDVEPKIGLDLLPQDQGIYRIETIPLADQPPGYEVDFKAAMQLVEAEYQRQPGDGHDVPTAMTRVEWDLNLEVAIQFPRFIHALPKSLIQTTGDRLLNQIVRQVSRRLTVKVQEDFHSTHTIAMPKKRKKSLWHRHPVNHSDAE
ncbi:DUF1997 domain-containing protein [Oscillatoria sp. FACHB-1407]|uniref:DUF1997 domain-containing protein n=1 Tax=Oscillatoria sp. FACHB-1407 TaxID=2692847 RepID=UPI001689F41D|nr:DUF1997 domain-containing protein [Oscillatoria sp. FACHB-1407]MBD2460768.1 DUF1997 domain-containing protein [Oscillatoria sp. FACHB-1407]